MRFGGLAIETVVCLTLAKWETVSGQFGAISAVYKRFRANAKVDRSYEEVMPYQPPHIERDRASRYKVLREQW